MDSLPYDANNFGQVLRRHKAAVDGGVLEESLSAPLHSVQMRVKDGMKINWMTEMPAQKMQVGGG